MISEIHKQVLDYIMDHIEQMGYPPSVREICHELQIKSTSTVHKYLNDLEEAGYIQRENAKNRSIKVVRQGELGGSQVLHVPLLGTVAAGSPIPAVEQPGEFIAFETARYSREELFALRIKGDSMIEAGIFNGDYIVAKRTPVVNNGDIAVVLVEDEATVKTFYKEEGHYRLQPENKTMEPIIAESASILGRVVAVLRYYD